MHRGQQLFIFLILLSFALIANAQKNSIGPSIYEDLYEKMSQETYNNWWHPHEKILNPFIISINSQVEFDDVENRINTALLGGHRVIKVVFGKGPFYFKSEHITLRGDSYPDATIQLVGNKTVVIPHGKYYRKGEIYDGEFSVKNVYIDSNKKDLNIWGKMYHSDAMVDVLDENKKLCRIHCPDFSLPSTAVSDETYLQLTEWYLMGTYKYIKAMKMMKIIFFLILKTIKVMY